MIRSKTAALIAAAGIASACLLSAGHSEANSYTHGSFAAGAYWWQQGPADCLPMAARTLIGATTGHVIDPAVIDATAARVAGYGPSGTDWAGTPALLAEYGVTAHLIDGGTMDDLRAALDAGAPVLAWVNAAPIWDIALKGYVYPEIASHVLVVEQIDDAAHTVTLVDSGSPQGRRETVPVPVFLVGWSLSNNAAAVVS